MIKSSEAYEKAIVGHPRRMYVKAVVDIEDPDMVQGDVSGSEQEQGISRPLQLWDKEFSVNANYASMEPNRWILDGSYILRPEDSATRDWEAGYVGALLSGADGVFAAPQAADIKFANVGVLQACSVAFSDRPSDGVAADFTVEVMSEGVAYYTKTVEGNNSALVPVTGFRVNNPDEIRVTITRWSLPGRRMRVAEIVPGVYEVWTGDEMCEFNVKHQADPTCLTLPYGTASIKFDNLNRRFDPRTKDGIFLMIEERQGIDLYMGPGLPDGTVEYKPLGTFYQSNRGWMHGDNTMTMSWALVDIIGLLSQRDFMWSGGEAPTTLKGWMEAITGQLGERFKSRVIVDPEYADLPVSISTEAAKAYKCGDLIRFLCIATGTWPHADAQTGYLKIGPLSDDGNKITLDNLNKYPAMSANEDAAAITVNEYTIEGNAPSCGNTVSVNSPFLKDADRLNRAKTLLSFYGGNKLETLGRGDPASEIGDVDAIWLAEGNATSARRIKQDLSFHNGVLMNCKSEFVRGEGWFRFTSRKQFLESTTWTVPEGVWQLRIILIGHGGSGTDGGDGVWSNNNNTYMGQWLFPREPAPKRGDDGSGGKVWSGVIDVNPGQVIQIQTGTGAGNTTLWKYSSANGKSYPKGFTDPATGDVYARPGAGGSPPGSGNGGSGGQEGRNGLWKLEGGKIYVDENGVHREYNTIIEWYPIPGKPGGSGATGSAIIYWEPPEVIEE